MTARRVGACLAAALMGLLAHAEAFRVVAPTNPTPAEATAAQELKDYLGRIVKSGDVTVEGKDGVVFHVGETDFARGKGLGGATLKDEAWRVRSFGRDVVLVGGGTRGTLYAVYHFLEDCCGVHWWWNDDEDVPEMATLALSKLDFAGRPHFRYRDVYTLGGETNTACDARTAVRNRLNRNGDMKIPGEWGGAMDYGKPAHAHTWEHYFPFKRDGTAHPEWFSLRDGKRVGGYTEGQLCLTCPGLVDEFARRVEAQIAADRAAAKAEGRVAPRLYDLSHNDDQKVCQCSNCVADVRKYGYSGQEVRLANAIAARLGPKYPDVRFTFLAYEYSEPLPSNGVVAAANVITKLCNTRPNIAASIYQPENRFMHDLVPAWRKVGENLFVWDYLRTFGRYDNGLPVPNEFYIFDNFSYYADCGVKGIFAENEHDAKCDMFALKFHLLCRAMEDPYQNKTRVMQKFMDAYYGAAGWRILMARHYLDRIRRERKAFISWFPKQDDFNWIRDEDIAVMNALYDEAEKAVKGDAKRTRRVAETRASLARLTSMRKRHPAEAGVSDKPFFDFPVKGGRFTSWDAKNARFVADAAVLRDKRVEGGISLGFGMHNATTNRTHPPGSVTVADSADYRWYSFGRFKIPTGRYFFYFTRTWHLQLPIAVPGMADREFEMKGLMRADQEGVWLTRIAFVEK